MADILYGVAAARGTIGYGPLAKRLGLARPHMGWHLGEVSRRSVAAGGPMWTALCVSQDTDLPQPQFFELARELRPDEYATMSDKQIWDAESERCYEAAGFHSGAA